MFPLSALLGRGQFPPGLLGGSTSMQPTGGPAAPMISQQPPMQGTPPGMLNASPMAPTGAPAPMTGTAPQMPWQPGGGGGFGATTPMWGGAFGGTRPQLPLSMLNGGGFGGSGFGGRAMGGSFGF